MENNTKRKIKDILSSIVFVFAALAIASYLFSSFQVRNGKQYLPTVFGLTGVTIETGSMAPVANVGDYVLIKIPEVDDIEVGDIITFVDNSFLVTHRVEEIINENGQVAYVTKGDANNVIDKNTVNFNKVAGVGVLVIPKLGMLFKWITSTTGMFVIGIIILGLLIFPDNKSKKKK